jgi:S-adenosylmethionine synthetase
MLVTFASESVTEGHPDKVCDKISDSVLDAALTLDPKARVACETLVSEHLAVITGEVSESVLHRLDIAAIARQTIRDIGYTTHDLGFCGDTCEILVRMKPQSPDISQGVSGQGLFKEQGAGDQGMMFGYATKEARLNDIDTEFMPTPIYLPIVSRADLQRSGNRGLFPVFTLTARPRWRSSTKITCQSGLPIWSFRPITRRAFPCVNSGIC